MRPLHIFFTILIFSTLAGCKKFLDAPPEKKNNLEIKNTESLDLLLNHFNVLFDRSRELVYGSDSYGLY
ncbi:MAG TPA: hypothetical protein VIK74_04495, partial [Parasegetibacter sp.]